MQNNPITEIFLGIAAVLLVLGAIVLLYVGTIDGTFATLMFGAAAALFGGNLALKAPSPTQQQNLQQAMSDLTNVIPVIFQHTHAVPSAPPVVAAPAQPAPQVTGNVQQTANVPLSQPVPFVPIPAAAAQSPVPHPPTSTLPWTGQQQPFPPSSTFPLPVVPK